MQCVCLGSQFNPNVMIFYFFLISKKCFIQKCKAPLDTQGVYTGTTKTAHKKKPEQTHRT
jgi:hypothetical protein